MDKQEKTEYSFQQESSTFQTGSTKPPKSHRGLILFLLGLVIFLGGIATALGITNLQLFKALVNQQEDASMLLPLPTSMRRPLLPVKRLKVWASAERPYQNSGTITMACPGRLYPIRRGRQRCGAPGLAAGGCAAVHQRYADHLPGRAANSVAQRRRNGAARGLPGRPGDQPATFRK